MARLALVGNDTAQAEAALDEVLSSRPDTADGWALKAGILTRQGKMREAAEAYEKVIALRPADVRAFTGLVPIILSLDGPEASGKVLARLAKAAPTTPATAYLDALVSFAKGERKDDVMLERLKSFTAVVARLSGGVLWDNGRGENRFYTGESVRRSGPARK